MRQVTATTTMNVFALTKELSHCAVQTRLVIVTHKGQTFVGWSKQAKRPWPDETEEENAEV